MPESILLIDEEAISTGLINVLTREGFNVDVCESPKDAHQQLKELRYRATIVEPHVICDPRLDWQLQELQDSMASAMCHMYVAVLSSHNPATLRSVYGLHQSQHYQAHYHKPILIPELVTGIKESLKAH
jgi:DNA-binding NtrC family response regulator